MTVSVPSVIFFIISTSLCPGSSISNTILQDNGEVKKYNGLFSTKTCYRYVQNLDTSLPEPPNCRAVQLNMIFRHGTRYPSVKDVKRFDKLMNILQRAADKMADEDSPLKKWQLSHAFKREYDKDLTSVGDDEMYQLGRRFAQRFPSLFKTPLNPRRYDFRSTCKRRSSQSAMAFSLGLFENLGTVGPLNYLPVPLSMRPCDEDPVLRFYDICNKYEKEVLVNPTALSEVKKFTKTPTFQKVLHAVKARLGIPNHEEFDSKVLIALFKLCAMSVAVLDQNREACQWCSAFKEDEYNVLEYVLDLKNFYKRSSAYNITFKSSCPLLKEIVTKLQDAVNDADGKNSYLGLFHFSHGETLLPLFALMGIFTDGTKLTADNFEEMQDRHFKGSLLAPFSGNIAFVLFKCDEGFKVQVYVNERLVKLPCCESEYDCPFTTFEECYAKSTENCNLAKMCNNTKVHSEL